MHRRHFIKECTGGLCTCAVAGMIAPMAAAATEDKKPEDWRLPFVQARYGKLVEILSAEMGPERLDAALRELGKFCASGMKALEQHKGHVDDFIRDFCEKSGESVTYDREKGIIRVVGPERPGCFCPLIDSRSCPKIVCSCSLGWQQQVYETLLGRRVEVRLLESVVRGGKRCAFEIRILAA